MFSRLQNPLVLLARVLLAVLFIPAGLSKISGFAGTAGYIASVGLPLPEVGAALAIVVEVGAGLALLLGWQTRWAALALAVFTVAASFFFHPFWVQPDQQLMFIKNLAVAGGLLTLVAFGGAGWSWDAKRAA